MNPPPRCSKHHIEMDWERCEYCGGDGVNGHDCGEDCCPCLDPEDNVICDMCGGFGGYWACLRCRQENLKIISRNLSPETEQ